MDRNQKCKDMSGSLRLGSSEQEQYSAMFGLICNSRNLQFPVLLLETKLIVFLLVRIDVARVSGGSFQIHKCA